MMFDNEFAEKLKSIGFSTKRGTSERKFVINEDDGSVAGSQTVHWDGRQDAKIKAKPIAIRSTTQGETQ